jgi:hypothetical protein
MAFNGFKPKREKIPDRRSEDAFKVMGRENIVVEFPLKCPQCGKMLEKKDVRAYKGLGGRAFLEDLSMGCVIMMKELPQMTDPQQVMLEGTEEATE